jgi:thiosulfate reductase cytochrome b subunit
MPTIAQQIAIADDLRMAEIRERNERARLFAALRTAVLLAVWLVLLPLLILAGGGALIAVIYLGSAS